MGTHSRHNDRIGIRLAPEEREALEHLAADRSLSDTVRDLLAQAIRRREEYHARETFRHEIVQDREALRAELAEVRKLVDSVHDALTAVRSLIAEFAGVLDDIARLAADGATHARIAAACTHAFALRQLQGIGIRDGYEAEAKQAVHLAEKAIAQLRNPTR